ncbi:MAG: sigma-54-dependent Fis family transcriptional regulator [Spirochaetales bacterium]|nr:sigma-54-dependent Fis family transcriptional regulator [Spirochaetales bacterium]
MNILIIDDEKGIRTGLTHLFRREEYQVFDTGEYDEALAIVNTENINVAVIDIRLGERNGTELLKEIHAIDRDVICLMVTGYGSISNAVDAMKNGASDYILKPIDNGKILQAVNHQLELKILMKSNDYLKSELMEKVYNFDFLTNNKGIKDILKTADRIKDTEATIMITGDSGTGKEILSRYFHFTSIRKDESFVGVNCAALSDTLLLSELFGHEKGAFTGAYERKKGKFELADRGTLFLDEIGDMSLETQAKLLRVLEERSFQRVGGNKNISVDLRVIAATNKDLSLLIKENKFREDLYYRLNVFSFHLSPLKERPEDIPLLSNHFIETYNKRYSRNVSPLSETDKKRLEAWNWPGNVRELQNVINQGVLLSDGDALNLNRNLNILNGNNSEVNEAIPEALPGRSEGGSLQEQLKPVLAHYEKEILKRVLIRHKYNKTTAAEELGITRKTLSRKVEIYDL